MEHAMWIQLHWLVIMKIMEALHFHWNTVDVVAKEEFLE
jgi:hypothetical protein